ncbi:MAG TPA: helix-turn-helix transcriptional regulator [Acidimicrobiia bacterium]|nr:helix-turn-helix transcriptional regulator [Acidimicrobiia bacterium]
MRRKPGAMLAIEESILTAGLDLRRRGEKEFHGFAVAKRMQEIGEAAALTAHGTLYKALGRLAATGLLESRWEDADIALAEGRPRRRLYRITALGEKTLAAIRANRGEAVASRRDRLAPS